MRPSSSSISPTRTRSAAAGPGWRWLLLKGGAAGEEPPTCVLFMLDGSFPDVGSPQVVQVCGRAHHPAAVWHQPPHAPACIPRPRAVPPAPRLQSRAVAHESAQPRHVLQPPDPVLQGLPPAAVQRGHAVLHARFHL